MEILPYLTTAKRGYPCKGDLCEVIRCILYKLKTGCQWHMIPTMAIFTEVVLHYKTIFGKFRQWCKDGSSCGFDYCEMCDERLDNLQRINPNVKEICLSMVECIKLGISADDIFKTLSSERPLTILIAERQITNNSIRQKPLSIPNIPPKQQNKQSSKKDLQTWEVVLRCIGAVVGFVLLAWLVLWLIAEFVFPAILLGLIFLSFLFTKK